MEQRLSLVTLGVRDLARSVRFFEALGWRRSMRAAEGVAFFQCGGLAFGLYPFDALAADAGVPAAQGGSAAIALAHNARTRDAVDAVMAEAAAAGAEIVKPAEEAFWGGYSGYFRDPDGHLWEIAWNPGFALDETGALTLPD
tara:strand:- start:679 stop:1104 length:426 start_codon:yes stop_codon:yes gene_type:complete